MPAAISFSHAAVGYGDSIIIDNLNLDIERGEFFTLLGPSGCGKSTLLRAISGLSEIARGTLYLDGRDVTSVPPETRGVGMVFQSYALFPHLSVAQNVAFGLRKNRATKAHKRNQVTKMLEIVGIAELADRHPSELSGGQQQRVAIARSLVPGPEILLLDEPLSNLDVKLRVAMRDELKRIQCEIGFTAVNVTHDQEEALVMSDRIAVLREGKVQQIGKPREIYQRPASSFVCDFVGAVNQITPQIAALLGRQLRTDQLAYLRPEAIVFGKVHNAVTLPARVQHLSYLGALSEYTLSCFDTKISVMVLGAGGPELDTEVEISIIPDQLMVVNQ